MGNHRVNPFARGNNFTRDGMRVLDQFGREIKVGDVLHLSPRDALVQVVVEQIRPNLQPNAPPNSMTVMMSASIVTLVPASVKIADLTLVRTAEEVQGENQAANPDKVPELPKVEAPPMDPPTDVAKPTLVVTD